VLATVGRLSLALCCSCRCVKSHQSSSRSPTTTMTCWRSTSTTTTSKNVYSKNGAVVEACVDAWVAVGVVRFVGRTVRRLALCLRRLEGCR
jgi:hypothetical protein